MKVKSFEASSDESVLQNSRFLRSILGSGNKSGKFHDFLSRNQLSPHVWIMARKPNKRG
jgi:hypothetical protein